MKCLWVCGGEGLGYGCVVKISSVSRVRWGINCVAKIMAVQSRNIKPVVKTLTVEVVLMVIKNNIVELVLVK